MNTVKKNIIILFFKDFIYLFERDSACAHGEGEGQKRRRSRLPAEE